MKSMKEPMPTGTLRLLSDVSSMYFKGKSQRDIGKILKVSQVSISNDLRKLKKEWTQSALVDFDEAKGKELHRIDVLEVANWDAWERSKKKKEVKLHRVANSDKHGVTTTKEKREETYIGDPRFLEGVAHCIEMRSKILDLYTEHTTNVSMSWTNLVLSSKE